MAGRFACIWRAPFTSVQVLQPLLGNGPTDVRAITPDGSVAVGGAYDNTGISKMVRWNTSTLAVTQLADALPTQNCLAGQVSADASVITGGQSSTGTDDSTIVLDPMIRCTGGGTTATLLLDQTGGTGTDIEWGGSPTLSRRQSDDGSIVTGNANNTNASAGRWINGTYSGLLGIATTSGTVGPQCSGCSHDGSTIVGNAGNSSIVIDAIACLWISGSQRLLISPVGVTGDTFAYFTNGDGSIVWGEAGSAGSVYWSGVTTPSGDGVHYGVVHPMATDGRIQGVAEDPGVGVAVGSSSSSGTAYRWNGTAATVLNPAGGGSTAAANGCNHDGSIAVGYCFDASSRRLPVYWDATNTPHALPSLADPTDYYQGEAYGISRDGSVIFGIIDVADAPDAELTDAELLFQPTVGFVDLSVVANRRKFIAAGGTPSWMGSNGALPFDRVPAVYLTTLGPPLDFAANNGAGGGFAPTDTIDPTGGPGCTPYFVTEAAGPAYDPQWRLTVSDDGGRTWSTLVKPRSIGKLGEYLSRLRWLKMGQSRERMIRLECTDPIRRNIVGIYIDAGQGMT
jgi:uncharacterized membrane protein